MASSPAAAACTPTADPPLGPPTWSAGTGDAGSGAGGDLNFGDVTGGGTGSGCSADMRDVVDAEGNVVAVCPPELGCFQGRCVPACEAAEKAGGSIGCDYLAPSPPFFQNELDASVYSGACHAVFLANTWPRHASIRVAYGGESLDASAFTYLPSGIGPSTTYTRLPESGIPPGEVAVLFLSHRPGAASSFGSLECPRAPAVLADVAVHDSGTGAAFQVASDTPVSAYDILPYGGASSFLPSASLLFPRSTWGKNYVALAPHARGLGKSWLMIVAAEDDTTVDLVPPSRLPGGGGAPGAPANAATRVTLDAGDVMQWMGADPSGAVLQSSKPIGVWTGNTYLQVATDTSPAGGGQDAAHQQIAPISALGSEYVGAGVVSRLASQEPESVVYRLLGVADGTALSWDPAPPPGAPAALAAGEVAEFEATSLFSVRSQDGDHPFMLTHYMPGAPAWTRPGCAAEIPIAGSPCMLGDEEWVIQLPPEQFLERYVFFTDPTYATTSLVITRVKGPNGFADVELSCLGPVTGWRRVGAAGAFEVAHVDLSRGFVGASPACETSLHEARSAGAFGVTVWGTDFYASYGYPAGGNVERINDVVAPPVPR
ncbi:IgGFc-binding protein [Sorangium cellulosum]|uniref:IgGFc-binding protein n=1 Tax=Sorangium cellulosum TaxID=56 RepID=UPI001650F580|nr:IgGFc-binding protein [Sorangium cellulosum]